MTCQPLFSVSIRGFQSWLDSNGASFSTQAAYGARIRSVLKAQRVDPENPDLPVSTLDVARVHFFVAALSPATAALTAAAWKSFCTYVSGAGVHLEPLPSKRSTVAHPPTGMGAPVSRLPTDIEVVVWALFGSRGVPAPVLGALRWGHVVWVAGSGVDNAAGVELPNFTAAGLPPWRWFALAPWRILWAWSAGDRPQVGPDDALLAGARGSPMALPMPQIQRIYQDGERGLVPAYLPAPDAAPAAPPALPPSLRESSPAYPSGFVPPVISDSDDSDDW